MRHTRPSLASLEKSSLTAIPSGPVPISVISKLPLEALSTLVIEDARSRAGTSFVGSEQMVSAEVDDGRRGAGAGARAGERDGDRTGVDDEAWCNSCSCCKR